MEQFRTKYQISHKISNIVSIKWTLQQIKHFFLYKKKKHIICQNSSISMLRTIDSVSMVLSIDDKNREIETRTREWTKKK